jgi:hypothetical protein
MLMGRAAAEVRRFYASYSRVKIILKMLNQLNLKPLFASILLLLSLVAVDSQGQAQKLSEEEVIKLAGGTGVPLP